MENRLQPLAAPGEAPSLVSSVRPAKPRPDPDLLDRKRCRDYPSRIMRGDARGESSPLKPYERGEPHGSELASYPSHTFSRVETSEDKMITTHSRARFFLSRARCVVESRTSKLQRVRKVPTWRVWGVRGKGVTIFCTPSPLTLEWLFVYNMTTNYTLKPRESLDR